MVAAIRSMIVAWSVSGRPRQFCVMRQNKRCSILFPFRRARRIVSDLDGEIGFVRKLLEFNLPEPHACTV